ncbi:MAG: hypothetical protein EOM80_02815 [Erysipelotrichia bacterium]|nr:hypothetical protein [Candidatus Riflebacteria bacterium]NCB37679.1 hypothetical protein [Erysipelotrichia bacterium]
MFDSRVTLLSDYAEQYVKKGRLANEGSFWQNMTSIFSRQKPRPMIYGIDGTGASTDVLLDEGFAPFCKIDERVIHIKKNSDKCAIAISQGDEVWDLSEWGEDYLFVTRFLAECYFMITRDDFHIDEEERTVFLALVGCIDATSQEILDARNILYWTLVDQVMEDDVLTDEELSMMAKIREELELNDFDARELHQKALNDYYELVRRQSTNPETSYEKLERIGEMARILGVKLRF